MKRMKMLMGLVVVFLVFGSPVFAELIDFRDGAWCPAYGLQSFTVGSVTVTCNPYGDSSNEDFLYWEPIYSEVDGFGVRSPDDPDPTVPSPDGEGDEIDTDSELFHVVFDSPTLVYGVWVADLYAAFPPEPRSPEWVDWNGWGDGSGNPWGSGDPGPGEGGAFRPDGTDWIWFWGQDSDQTNGEQYVPVGMTVSLLEFAIFCANSDYSVIGIDVVPVPAAFLLGVLGLGCAGWRLRKLTAQR